MVRLGLVTYLALVTVAGPWLCCCTTARLIASLEKPCHKDEEHPLARANCCRRPSTPQRDRSPRDEQQPGSPQCPCKQGQSEVVLSIPELNGDTLQQLLLFPSESTFLPLPAGGRPILPFSGIRPLPGDSWPLPFLSAEDILFSLHMLRC
jgi:hypothetical protein